MFKSRDHRKRFGHGEIKAEEFGQEVTKKKRPSQAKIIRRWMILLLMGFLLASLFKQFNKGAISTKISQADQDIYKGPVVDKDIYYRGKELPLLGEKMPKLVHLKETSARLANLEMLPERSREAQREQVETYLNQNLPVEVENSIGMRFRLIPAGHFFMGSPDSEYGRVNPKKVVVEDQHAREVKYPIYVGKYEVTQAQWDKVMGTKDPDERSYLGPNRPKEEVTWFDAANFCKKLCELEGVPAGRYRLLQEFEWEYSCRAGSTSAFSFKDPKDADHFMEYRENNNEQTRIVGGKRPNAWGLFNMHGNVMEWCNDYYIDYFTGKNPDGLAMNVRGGSWMNKLGHARSASRGRLGPTSHGNVLGFRIMRTIHVELAKLKKSEEPSTHKEAENKTPSDESKDEKK